MRRSALDECRARTVHRQRVRLLTEDPHGRLAIERSVWQAGDVQRRHSAWLVDLDGTLYFPKRVKLAMAAELSLAGARHARLIREFRRQHEALRQGELHEPRDLSPYQRQVERTAAAMGCSATEVDSCVREWMIRRPSKWLYRCRRRALLRELIEFREQGGLLALVSDYPASEKLLALGCSGLFGVVVANGEQGGPSRLKPHPEGYLLAAQRLDVPPSECLVIGDREDADGLAARQADMAFRRIS